MKVLKTSYKPLLIISLLFFIHTFSNPALAQYDVNNTGISDVNGLTGSNVLPAIGSNFGTVQAIADTNNAYALFGDGNDIQISGDVPVDGNISAQAGNNGAYGLHTNGDGVITTGAINGSISATAGNQGAYGLYATDNGTVTTGALNGTITAAADAEYAYGLFSSNSIVTGDVNGTISASAYLDAYGLRSYNSSITTGKINGIITAITNSNSAFGLSAYTSITTQDVNGVITSTAGNDYAYGLSAFTGAITTGAITNNSSITVNATNSSAYGLISNSGSITTGDIDGAITVTAGLNNASGLESGNALSTGNISGDITINAGGNNAYGLKSSNGVSIGDIDISSRIYAHTGASGAYGIFGSGDQITIGGIDGTVYGLSDTNDSFGIYSYSNSLTTGEITGNVWAYSVGEYSYGILSYGAMDITVNGGYIAGHADANNSTGAAIQSGRLDSHVLNTQNANDSIEIVSGSRILGDIDLGMPGTDNDVLTLSGVDANSTTLNDDLKNIETINLTGGTWYLNGAISNNENGIAMTGGVLGGTGTFGDLNVTAGTLAPGNSIGTTTIDGDFTIEPGSTLEIEVDNSGNSDKLLITGNATINGGTVKAISTETIGSTHEYTIIEANNVSGEFDVLDTALLETILSQYSAGLGYTSNLVTLTVIPEQFNNTDFLITPNQIALGSALQQISDNGGNTVTTQLQGLSTLEEVRDAYDQLCGQTRTSLALVSVTNNNRFKDTVSNRLHNTKNVYSFNPESGPLFAMAQPEENTSVYDTDRNLNSFALGSGTKYFASEQWGMWLRGYGVFGERDQDTDSLGYKYKINGTGFGMDLKVRDGFLFGLTGGYSDGQVDYSSSRDKTDISSIPVGIYGSWFTKKGYFDSIISYASMEYETERYVDLTSEKLEGEFDGYETSAYMESGLNWFFSKNILIQPMSSFQVSYLNLDSYSETGGASALSFDEQSYKSYKGSLGMKIKTRLVNEMEDQDLTLELRGRWLHEFGDTESNIHANFIDSPSAIFKVSDSGLPRDSAVFGIGLRQINEQNLMFFIDYDTSLNSEDTSHVISAGFRYRW